MAHSEKISSGPGSIVDTASRLINWSKRGSWGLARVEYISEFARERVLNDLRHALAEAQMPFAEIELPPNQSASEVVQYLIRRLQEIESGVVSVTGFATAFSTDVSLEDSLRVLNFNRENIALPNLRQVWWMPYNFAEVFVSAVPDLDSWFIVRLHLAEVVPAITSKRRTPFFRYRNSIGWNVPPRSPFFTGRDEILETIHNVLSSQKVACVSGVAGVGKTQTAVEYAHRYWNDYQVVLWAVADTETALTSGIVEIANVLGLPEAQEADQTLTIGAVRRWLTSNKSWLLILDEAIETSGLLTSLISLSSNNGSILLTSRRRFLDRIKASSDIQLEELTPKESVDFLYKRAGRKEAGLSDKNAAYEIVTTLDCLPLAIELAGAYIRETQVGYHDYLFRLRERLSKLTNIQKHYDGVLETLSAAFDINSSISTEFSEYSIELLGISSFLYTDKIPVELFMWADPEVQKFSNVFNSAEQQQLAVYELLNVLARNSLIHIDGSSQTFSIHRLLQTLTRESVDRTKQRIWLEKTVQIVNQVFPSPQFENWPECERILPHALTCAEYIKNWRITSTDTLSLLSSVGRYLTIRARYTEAELILRQALKALSEIEERMPLTEAAVLENLAADCYAQGRYKEAESYYNRVLELEEQAYGAMNPVVAHSLTNLAQISLSAHDYERAGALLKQALQIGREALGEEHPQIAKMLNNLGFLYLRDNRYEEAEQFFKQALELGKRILDYKDPVITESLQGLASLYLTIGDNERAKYIYKQLLELDKSTSLHRDPNVAVALKNLAIININEQSYLEAESLLRQAFEIERETFGEEHPITARTLSYLAFLWIREGRYVQAESALKRSLSIQEQFLGASHPDLADTLNIYAILLRVMKREEEAKLLEDRAMRISRKEK